MSSSQSGGTPPANYFPKPKYVVLMQHGYNGNGSSLSPLADRANNIETFKLDLIAKAAQTVTVFTNAIKNLQISLTQQGKTLENKTLFIRTEFSNNKGNVLVQFQELDVVVNRLRVLYGGQVKIILVGHSKGGLVGVTYAFRYPGKIQGLISIGTPYNYQLLWNFFSGDETLNSPTDLLIIKEYWNALQFKRKAYAIASQAIDKSITICTLPPIEICTTIYTGYSDGVVDWANARGDGYNNIQGRDVGYRNLGYTHNEMLTKSPTYNLVIQLLNTM